MSGSALQSVDNQRHLLKYSCSFLIEYWQRHGTNRQGTNMLRSIFQYQLSTIVPKAIELVPRAIRLTAVKYSRNSYTRSACTYATQFTAHHYCTQRLSTEANDTRETSFYEKTLFLFISYYIVSSLLNYTA